MISEHSKQMESQTSLEIDATGCGNNFNVTRHNFTDMLQKKFSIKRIERC